MRRDVRRDNEYNETYELDHECLATLLELADAMEETTGAGCATGRVDKAGKSFTRARR